MKKICLSVVGLYLMFLSAFSQSTNSELLTYKSEDLKLDEANLVSGYYGQNANHSAITGGIGSEQLTDVSNTFELKFLKWNNDTRNTYHLDMELGLDHHTAASQAYVSQTGASKTVGTRFYPSINWSVEKPNHNTIGFGLSYSTEFNYHSVGLNFNVGRMSRNQNREVSFKAQAFLDKVTLIEPSEFAPKPTSDSNTISTYTTASGRVIQTYSSSGASSRHIPGTPRNTFSGSLSLSQIVNKNLQFAVIADLAAQTGYLGLPFHRVYFTDSTEQIEKLPSSRIKIPLGFRVNYFMGDKIIWRTYYRYYTDDWGIRAQTASLEIPYKLSAFVSLAPFYRFYSQTASPYFAPYMAHKPTDTYYTSNYAFSAFNAHYAGLNFRFTPQKGVYIFDMIEVRYGHYVQTTGLEANNIAVHIRFK